MGVLIILMALAHPLHPIKGRSNNKRLNLWVRLFFPPDYLVSGACTTFIIYVPHIIAALLVIEINSF